MRRPERRRVPLGGTPLFGPGVMSETNARFEPGIHKQTLLFIVIVEERVSPNFPDSPGLSPQLFENMGGERMKRGRVAVANPATAMAGTPRRYALTIGNIEEFRHEKTAPRGGYSPGSWSPDF